MIRPRDVPFVVGASILGALVWIYIGSASGEAEPWDSPVFFSVGLPLMLTISAVAGFFRPGRPWVWGVSTVVLQPFVLLFTSELGPLVLVGLIFFAVFAALCTGTAFIGQWIRTRLVKERPHD